MDWILIGVVGGSLVVSAHPTQEACYGRQHTLQQHVPAACYPAPRSSSGLITSTPTCCGPALGCTPC